MKKIMVLMTFFLLNYSFYSESIYDLKDITPEHWAYKSIENLVEKGIIVLDEDIFDGEKTINRYEIAYFLSKTLDKLEDEKANRDDLLILEHIVYEFSEELAKFGFNSKNYLDRLVEFEKNVEQNRLNSEKNSEAIADLNKRLKEIEVGNSRKSGFLENSNNAYSERIKYLEEFNLYLESGIDYLPGSSASTVDVENYKGSYKLGVAFQQDNFELMLESETSDNERKSGELTVKGQLESNVYKDFYLTFHTTDYERYLKSYFNNVIYDNHNSYTYEDGDKTYQYDYFDSYGLSFRNDKLGVYIEKTRTDYDNVYNEDHNSYGVSVDDSFTDTFNFIVQGKYKYFEGLLLKNGNTSDMDFELVARYPVGKVEVIGGLGKKIGDDRTVIGTGESSSKLNDIYKYDELTFINGEVVFGGKSNLTLGLEIKSEEVILYNNYYGSFRYQLSDAGSIKYKYEYLDSSFKTYQNHYILLNINGEKLNTYGGYNKIGTNKNYLVSEESTEDPYENETAYSEIMIKMEYTFNDFIKGKLGYLSREYTESDTTVQTSVRFIQLTYKVNDTMRGYVKYIENDGTDLNDRRLDIDNNMIDLDFDSKTGVIREAEEGRIELGIEIEF